MAEGAPNNLTLSVLSGPSSGESYALEGAVGHVIMGSGESAHIQFESPVVVANHVRLAIDEQGAAVAPATPEAPVFLNDDPVTEETPLKNGDILWMGNPGDEGAVMIQCHLEPATPVAETSEEESTSEEAVAATPEEALIGTEPEPALDQTEEPIVEAGVDFAQSDPEAVVQPEEARTPELEPATEANEPEASFAEPEVAEDAGEIRSDPNDAEQETVFLGAAEPTAPASEPAGPEGSGTAATDAPDAPAPAASEGAASPAPAAPPPMDEPQPWEEQPEDSVKAAWEVEQPPEPPPPPPGREDPTASQDAPSPPAAAATPDVPPAPKKPATPKPAVRRPPSRQATRTTRPSARPAPPPAASSSGRMLGIAAGVVVLLGGAAAAFFMFGRSDSQPAPSAPPVTVAQTLAPPTTLSVTEDPLDEVPLDEMPDDEELGDDLTSEMPLEDPVIDAPEPQPTPSPAQQAATPAPTPDRAAAARLLRQRQTTRAATPTPAPRSTPAPATPAQPSAAERQAQQVATLLGQADQAMAGSNFAQAQSLYDAALKLDPANAKAKAGKSKAASSAAAASKKFVAGRTVYIGKGKGNAPAGFSDGANDPKYKGSLTIEIRPSRVPAGAAFTATVYMTNEGTKDIEPKQVTFTTRLNGKTSSTNAAPRTKKIGPGQRALVAETTGTWQAATRSWIFEAKIMSDRGDTYRSRLTWK